MNKEQLKQIIKEELSKFLNEGFFDNNQDYTAFVDALKREGIEHRSISTVPYNTERFTYNGKEYDISFLAAKFVLIQVGQDKTITGYNPDTKEYVDDSYREFGLKKVKDIIDKYGQQVPK